MRADDLGRLLELIRNGYGVGLTCKHFAQKMLADGELVQLFDISLTSPPHAYYLAYEQKPYKRPELTIFIAWMKKTFNKL